MNKRIRKKKRKQLDAFLRSVDLNKLATAQYNIEQKVLAYSLHQMNMDLLKRI